MAHHPVCAYIYVSTLLQSHFRPQQATMSSYNTLEFSNFRMLIGKIIKERFSHNLKKNQHLFSLQEI
jgi:hypothetical protein